ncbi:hypothetical protein RJ640_005498 [Escallonia rubra]|uniref:Gnk2-homologous domain-containing protein n=1 Tax=Escallonia rubra TaxID=112253 RepID=A0AA88S2V1_9ASTE|nr:hypothetical protein RJ640_005498 [Escallonia rubra]
MATQRWVLILYHTLLHLVCLTIAQPELLGYTCADTGNYTRDSTYSSNLDDVIYSPSINTTNFSSVSAGSDPDSVNGIALCRGDINQDVRRRCVDDSTRRLRQQCTDQKEAIGWYDDCMVRYSDRSIYQSLETSPYSYVVSDHTAPDVGTFNKALGTLLGSLRYEAAQGGSALKFASGNVSAPKNVTIYALVQCTPDLTAQQCDNCLKGTSWCCDGYTGTRYQNPSCNIGYALTQFYNVFPAAARQALPPPEAAGNKTMSSLLLHQVKVSSIDLLQMYQLCQAKVGSIRFFLLGIVHDVGLDACVDEVGINLDLGAGEAGEFCGMCWDEVVKGEFEFDVGEFGGMCWDVVVKGEFEIEL